MRYIHPLPFKCMPVSQSFMLMWFSEEQPTSTEDCMWSFSVHFMTMGVLICNETKFFSKRFRNSTANQNLED